MADLIIKKGNVLDSKFQVIAHQVNCQGVMGAGVAKAVKNKYPEVYEEYRSYCDEDLNDEIFGTCLAVEVNDGKVIANLFGQNEYGVGVVQTNYKKLHSALVELKEYMIENGLITLSFPYMIGCGLAGGDVAVVEVLIRDVFDDSDIIYNFYDIN
jgi:O-acetyl-ADP-ribose deacetylase (regulator of RNase III)